jgi:NADPH:quinone reductase-like Zn-dependent oxidoreductase
MRAVVITKHGPPSVLKVQDRPDPPPPAAGQVRVAVRAAGVNFADHLARVGLYPDAPKVPSVVGYEVAGIVEAVGEGVDPARVGQRVLAGTRFGGYAEIVNAGANDTVALPDSMSFEQGAAIPVNYATAWAALHGYGSLQPGERVLVHAAAGGVGLLIGQWLKLLGAISIGTVGSPEKMAIAKTNGYTHLIDYRAEDFAARVKEITGGKGCDVVYDSVGHDTWRGSLKCLRARGMFVHFGQSSGMIADFKFSDLAAGGSLYASRPTLFDYIKTREELTLRAADLFAKVAAGQIRAHVGQRVALRDAAQAHRDLEARRTIGATVLLP